MKNVKHFFGKKSQLNLFYFSFIVLFLFACEKKEGSDHSTDPALTHSSGKTLGINEAIEKNATETNTTRTITNELQLSEQLLKSVVESSQALQQSITKFLDDQTDVNFNDAKNHWIICHNKLQAFSPYLAIQQNNPGLFSFLKKYKIALDSHPIQPGFLDYFSVYLHSGIVNDIALPLTASSLREQHGITDNSDVSLGFHAIEYMLWGEEGSRPLSDFAPLNELSKTQQSEGLSIVDLPNNRRRTLLQLQANLLTDDLSALEFLWTNPQGVFQKTYFSLPPESRTQLIRSAATSRLRDETILLAKLLTNKDANPDNQNTIESHNQFSKAYSSDIIALLQSVNTSFFEETAPFTSDHLLTENQKINNDLNTTIIELSKATNEWPIAQSLAKKTNELLEKIIDQLDGKITLTE